MAHLFKPHVTRYRTPDGKVVPKETPGAHLARERTRKWYGQFVDQDGISRRVPLCTDKAAARMMLHELVVEAERGGPDPLAEQAKRPLSEHVDDFRRHLEAKNDTAEHVQQTIGRLQTVLDGCRFSTLQDLLAGPVAILLADARGFGFTEKIGSAPTGKARSYREIARRFGVSESTVTYWRRRGAPITPRSENDLAEIARWRRDVQATGAGISASTSNHYLRSVKSFGTWLVREQRLATNPFSHLATVNTRVDVRRERRVSNPEEFSRLVGAARRGRAFRQISGADRALLYILAANTGLRASELASLTVASFDLAGDHSTVTVEAAYSKHRRQDILPLRADLVVLLCPFLSEVTNKASQTLRIERGGKSGSALREPDESAPAARLWPGTWADRGAEMIRKDLAAARRAWIREAADPHEHRAREMSDFLAYEDSAGCVFDFHALRHQFISNLARSGAHPKEAQALARHSSITLTMDRYTHLGIVDLQAALDRLPALPTGNPEMDYVEVRATGTDGRPAEFVALDVALNVAKTAVHPSPVVSVDVAQTGSHAAAATKENPLKTRGFDVECLSLSARDASEADGTRTRNHRIDSPVL